MLHRTPISSFPSCTWERNCLKSCALSSSVIPILFAAILFAAPVLARQPDGTLGLIQTPNDGVPALVLPGARFEAVLEAEAPLYIESGGARHPLDAAFAPLPGGSVRAVCTVPQAAAPGPYTLCAQSEAPDSTPRAVWVLDKTREYYTIAHVSDTHIGKEKNRPRRSDDVIRDVIAAVNASDAHFAVITGDLTETGAEDEFRRFLAVLDTCALPTFVCPGNHDRQALHYERFFGPLVYAFTFGPDGYLVFDTKDYRIADELGEQDGALQRLRREIKPTRFSIGLTHRYEPMMGLRAQLALFVDNPLDFLLFGHWHRENTNEDAIPWGDTRISAVPAAIHGAYRLLDMTARGLIPRKVQYVEGMQPEAKPDAPAAAVSK